MTQVDLGKVYTGTYLANKEVGISDRDRLGLPAYDKDDIVYHISIPSGFDCNQSYMDGLLTESVLHLGARSKFFQKYIFPEDMPEDFSEMLNNTIADALALIRS
ncbi:MAG: hypothetical protein WC043_05620 [Pseudobdellovibrionaceae bacterium]